MPFLPGRRAGAESGFAGQLDDADLVPRTWKPNFSYAVTVSAGIRVSRLGWNAMKPGIDGVETH
jgi:hypothetical protein